jgi:hypothetical protein
MLFKAPLQIIGYAGIEGLVGAFDDIDIIWHKEIISCA